MRMKKFLAVGILSAVLAFSGLALFGCGGTSDEQMVRDAVSAELDSIKNITDESVAAFTEGAGENAFADYGVSNEQFMTEYFAGFDYSIDSVTVEGDVATVEVSMTMRTMTDFEEALTTKTEEFVASDEMLSIESEDELNQKIGELLIDSVKATELQQLGPVTITYNKVDGQWVPDASSGDILTDLMM